MGPTPGRIEDDFETVDAFDDTEEQDDATVEIEQTRVQIEQTRSEMSDTIDAIKEKLSPQNMMQQAKETVREATIGRVQDAASDVMDSAREAASSAVEGAERIMSSASSSAREAGSTIIETIQRNPLPTALIGIGLSWLWMNTRKQTTNGHTSRPLVDDYTQGFDSTYSARYGTQSEYGQQPSESGGVRETLHGAQERVGELAGQVQERASQVAGRVQERASQVAGRVQERVGDMGATIQQQAHRATDTYERWMQENPLAVGAVAMALGAAVGMAIPETPRERRLMGEARDRLVDRAQEVTQEVAQKVQTVAQEAMDTAREEARTQGLTQ